jgi:serine/threonine protein kinase
MSWAGTELYMAPEQLDKKEYGSEVDWWALGALTWEMATGDHPFYSNNHKSITHNIMKKKLILPSWLPASTHSLLKGLLTVSQNMIFLLQ